MKDGNYLQFKKFIFVFVMFFIVFKLNSFPVLDLASGELVEFKANDSHDLSETNLPLVQEAFWAAYPVNEGTTSTSGYGVAQQVSTCDIPEQSSACTPPSSYDVDLNISSDLIWSENHASLGDPQDFTQKVRITGSGAVIVPNSLNLIFKSSNAVLVIDGPDLIVNGGNFQMDESGSRFIMNGGALRIFGQFQQKENTVQCITGTLIECGEEDANEGFTMGQFNNTGNPSSSSDWQNDGGYRWLEDCCINVTHDFQLQSSGSGSGTNGVDVIINCCFEIGDRGANNATGTPFGSKDGDDSGNWQNNNRQYIFGTDIIVANGDFQNSNNTMTVCDVDIKLNKSGNFQINSGTLEGEGLCIAAEDAIENSGTWTADVVAWYSHIQNSIIQNNPITGFIPPVESNMNDILDQCFTECCTGDECTLDDPTIAVVCDDAGTPYDPSDDTFTYTIQVTGTDTGNSYSISGDDNHAGLSYGVINGPFGPFDISSGNLTITITDSDDSECQLEDQVVNAPATCSDQVPPDVTHLKSLSSVTLQADGTYDVVYNITVTNIGGSVGSYDLYDDPDFDGDININSASYTSNAPGNPGNNLVGNGPWTLGDDISINVAATHTYTLTVNVTLNLTDGISDDDYTACGETNGIPQAGEGLYNLSQLDTNNDGIPDEEDEACGDLPFITHYKDINTITPQINGTYNVEYTIIVSNIGGASGTYDLYDDPTFDDDITINLASFTSDAPGNPGNALAGGGPWQLADDQSIIAGGVQTYILTVNVTLDLRDGVANDIYTACSETTGTPIPGEGLYNLSQLDRNNDGIPDEEDDACGDLPFVIHSKSLSTISQQPNGTYNVSYIITVSNIGGATGTYDLFDDPTFDDDISINSASYVSNAPGNPGNALAGDGPWTLADDQSIAAGGIQTYTLTVNVTLDLTDGQGDDDYTACSETTGTPIPGEGLYNLSQLDRNNDGIPDEEDDACGDLPFITHYKDIIDILPQANGTYFVIYTVTVSNIGGATGTYDLYDEPTFDDDIAINSASFASDAPGNPGGGLAGGGPWQLADDQSIPAGGVQTYTLSVNVTLDLLDGQGDDDYTACSETTGTPIPGEGLYNLSQLDRNNDGIPDEEDDACGDLPFITHDKSFGSVERQDDGTYDVTYFVTVWNLGGVPGSYTLEDTPFFDDDISINSASYTSDAAGNPGGNLAGSGPWLLASLQPITHGDVHSYTLVVNVSINTTDGIADDEYTACGETTGTPLAGEGLFNQTTLDVNDDGIPEEIDDACGDLPAKIGDYVWEDISRDGIQDANEPPIEGVTVHLKDGNNNIISTTTTDETGMYCFEELDPGTYSVQFEEPYQFRFTFIDQGNDDTVDSDADENTGGMTPQKVIEEGDIDLTCDGGFYRRPGTNINDPCNCLDNSTTAENGQFGEEIEITNTYAGDTWVIIQQTGMYLTSSPMPPAAPIPVPLGTELEEHPVGGNLSDYSYEFIHIDDQGYTVTVTNGFDTLSIENNCEYPDFVELEIPLEPLCIIDPPFQLSGVPNVPGDVNFYLDGQLITVIDPAALGLGQFELTAEINPTDPEECISTVITIIIVIDDCVANLGDYVWEDMDADGNQDPGEPGIPDVTVKLLDTNNNVLDVTTTDDDGYYHFTNLAPGDYVVMFVTPDEKIQTVQDSGDTDETDSDAGDNGMTGVINLEEGETDNTNDAGYYCPASLGDYVWNDLDKDGAQDDGEPGIPSVVVHLKDANDNIIATTATNPNGFYLFDNLMPGTYSVAFETPDGFELTLENNTGDETNDSDAEVAMNGMTDQVTLSSGEFYPHLDAGYIGICNINASFFNITCHDNGTPSDPSDDTFTFEVSVTGDYTGTGWTANDPNGTSGSYGVNTLFGPYLISDGPLVIDFTDNEDDDCTTTITVNPPNPCSGQCSITADVLNIVCHDNGTPSDPSDDTFTFDLLVTGANTGSGWTANGVSGTYNVPTNFGPYPISGGSIQLSVQDNDDPDCTTSVTVQPPPPCSDECDIEAFLSNMVCHDNGTPTDPSDDTYTFEVTVIGANTGNGWTANDPDGTTGLYGQVVTFGPYLISDGFWQLTVTDNSDPNCNDSVDIYPPDPCSDQCDIIAVVANIVCHDNGTPTDPSDDTYTFELTVFGDNTGNGWTANDVDGTTGQYGQTEVFGPYLISAGAWFLTVTDNDDPGCSYTVNIQPPPPCSSLCDIDAQVLNIVCHDNGTPTDPDDDTFTFDLLVTGVNTSTTWTAGGVTGLYNVPTGFGPLPISGGSFQLLVEDSDNDGCYTTVYVQPPPPCSSLCDIDVQVLNIVCHDNGTPTDPDDDTFTFDLLVTGVNTGTTWTAGGVTGLYNVPTGFGPIPISGGSFQLLVEDSDNDGCNTTVYVQPPPPCSVVCDVYAIAGDPDCDDNGTPDNPNDDTFSFEVTVIGTNTSGSWVADDPNNTSGAYNVPTTFGPYPVSTGDLSFVIVDAVYDECYTYVTIELPDTPEIECPENRNSIIVDEEEFDLLCTDVNYFFNNEESFGLTGEPEVYADCGSVSWEFEDELSGGGCDNIVINRTFTAYNIFGNAVQCTQQISFRKLISNDIQGPDDVTFDCDEIIPVLDDNGNPHPDLTGYPFVVSAFGTYELSEDVCNLNAATYTDEETESCSGGIEIIRTWTIGDDCSSVDHTVEQIITIGDLLPPVVECPIANHYCPVIDDFIMVFETDSYECTATLEVPVPEVEDNCSDWTLVTTVEDADGNIIATILPGGDHTISGLEVGQYNFIYSVTDGCGNTNVTECPFVVADLTSPVAICIGTINVSLNTDGEARAYTQNIDFGSFDNCEIEEMMVRRLYTIDPVTCEPLDEPYYSDWGPYVDFSCCDIGIDVMVELMVVDIYGNYNTCWTLVTVEDKLAPYCGGLWDTEIACEDLPVDFNPYNLDMLTDIFGEALIFDNCSGEIIEQSPIVGEDEDGNCVIIRQFLGMDTYGNVSPNLFEQTITVVSEDGSYCGLCDEDPGIAGRIRNEMLDGIENVEVMLSGPFTSNITTATDGAYIFESVLLDENYVVTPHLDLYHKNGVTVMDLIRTQQHILGMEPFESPYQWIAGDVNNSQHVSTLDLIIMQQLILGKVSTFANNTSWRFVDANYVFTNTNNPLVENFPESIAIDNMIAFEENVNFVGVKVGDVNGTAEANDLVSVEERNTTGRMVFEIEDQQFVAGNEYRIDIYANDLEEILGYQLTLNYDRSMLEFLDIEYGMATTKDFGLAFLSEGALTHSWYENDRSQIEEGLSRHHMFTLVVMARENGLLSELLQINSRFTTVEAYNLQEENLDVVIEFNTENLAEAAFRLYQNKPNPFKDFTTIGFEIPEDGFCTLTILSVDGKVLQRYEGEYPGGYNEIMLNNDDLPSAGILYYILETEKNTAMSKMIRVRQ